MAASTAAAELDRPSPERLTSTSSADDELPATIQADVVASLAAARAAQQSWRRTTLKERLRIVRKFRHQIAGRSEQLVASVTYPSRDGAAETLAGELIPLADACKFLENEAAAILAPRRLSRRSRPLWLRTVSVELRREPFGVVLIVGAANYPLFLPGIQALQALVAGNAVLIKPGRGGTGAAEALRDTFVAAGLNPDLMPRLPEEPHAVKAAVDAGVDKVVLTGSAETGRDVQALLAPSLTPSVMELSGCDAVFVLENADLQRVAQGLAFGLRFNGSATCIAPRRVFVPQTRQAELETRLCQALAADDRSTVSRDTRTAELVAEAIRQGARAIAGGIVTENGSSEFRLPTVLTATTADMRLLQTDVFAPILSLVPVASIEAALAADQACPYALGAVVFGDSSQAQEVAERIDAGCVVINDIIAPTADPRVPFGGRGQSGFGVTRGQAGLEEMTQIKSIIHQHGRWLPHLEGTSPLDADLLFGFLGMSHGAGWRQRLRCAWSALRAARAQQKWMKEHALRRPKDGE